MRRGYSPTEVEQLRALAAAGATKREIAAELGRSFRSVSRKCSDLSIRTNGTPGPRPGGPRPGTKGVLGGTVTARLGAHVLARLQREAARRDESVSRLAQQILTIACEANLIDAVMDDGNGNEHENGAGHGRETVQGMETGAPRAA